MTQALLLGSFPALVLLTVWAWAGDFPLPGARPSPLHLDWQGRSGGQTIIGGRGSGDTLTLRANNFSNGVINVDSPLTFRLGDDFALEQGVALDLENTATLVSNQIVHLVEVAPTFTWPSAGQFYGYHLGGTYTVQSNPNRLNFFSALMMDYTSRSQTNGAAPWLPDLWFEQEVLLLDGSGVSATSRLLPISWDHLPTLKATNGANYTQSGDWIAILSKPRINADAMSTLNVSRHTVIEDAGVTLLGTGRRSITTDETMYVKDRSAATNTYAVESELNSGKGKYNLYFTGSAPSFSRGGWRIGDASPTPPRSGKAIDVAGVFAVDTSGKIPTVPAFRACGTDAGAAGSITLGLPSGHTTNDILLLLLESANEAPSCPSGYTQLGPQAGTGTAASSGSVRLTLCWKRDGGSESAPTISNPGNHIYGVICAFKQALRTGDPFHFMSSGVKATASTSTSATGGVTTVDNALIVVSVARGFSSASAQYSAEANADLTSVSARFDAGTMAGVGGGLMMSTGTKATAGTIGATTANLANSSAEAFFTFALVASDTTQPGKTPRACDVQSFTTCGVTSGNCPSDTWVKPTGAKTVEVVAIGGGSAGGAGRSATTAAGGGGGGGGAYQRTIFKADDLQSAMTVTVGRGGIGGSTQNASTASTVVNNGLTIVSAGGGAIGTAAASGDGGDGGTGGSVGSLAAAGTSGSGTIACTSPCNGNQGIGGMGAEGGKGTTTTQNGGRGDFGGGGGATGATSSTAGGTGGGSNFGGGGGGGGTVSGTGGTGGVGGDGKAGGAAHTSATASGMTTMGGPGGGGGDATTTGGNGVQCGGGGGGGGNATNSGGNGGDGCVTIITCF